jgi:hypothetical protein
MKVMDRPQIIRSLKVHAFVFLGLILVQFWLGMTINLEVSLPTLSYGGFSALIFYLAHFWLVISHAIIAIVILAVSAKFLMISLKSGSRALVVTGSLGLAAVLGAIYNGVAFLTSDQFFGNSIGMAMSAISAVVAYAVSLYYIGSIQSENAAMRI